MAKLIVSLGNNVLGHYFVDKAVFSIGRRSDNDICLDDPAISKEHAVVTTVANDQMLEDRGSSNGTFVNEEKVAKRILQNGDVIHIGPYSLKYVNQRATSDMDFDKTLMLDALPLGIPTQGRSLQPQLATALSSARALKATFPLGTVKGLKGEHAGRNVELGRVLVGFGVPGDQLAVIMRRPHGYYLNHVEGRRYPKVNGKSTGADPYPLQDQDIIEIGNDKLLFSLKS